MRRGCGGTVPKSAEGPKIMSRLPYGRAGGGLGGGLSVGGVVSPAARASNSRGCRACRVDQGSYGWKVVPAPSAGALGGTRVSAGVTGLPASAASYRRCYRRCCSTVGVTKWEQNGDRNPDPKFNCRGRPPHRPPGLADLKVIFPSWGWVWSDPVVLTASGCVCAYSSHPPS